MDSVAKRNVSDILMKVIDAAPGVHKRTTSYYTTNENRPVSPQEFEVWMRFVHSVVDQTSKDTGLDAFQMVKLEIAQIENQSTLTIEQKIQHISSTIANLTRWFMQNA